MKKFLAIALFMFAVALPAQAAVDLGLVNESIAPGRSLSVGLTSGNWYVYSNSNSGIASASVSSGALLVKGISNGTAVILVCTDAAGSHCMQVTITVTGNVLGVSVNMPHPAGSWVIQAGTVYYVHATGLIPVPTWSIFVSNGGTKAKIVEANTGDMSLLVLPLLKNKDSRVK